jgi:hypothetical protein
VRALRHLGNRLRSAFTSPRKTGEVQKGDAVQFAVAFSNSKVGAGRLTGSLFVKRLVCLNGMVIEEEQFASTHLGSSNVCNMLHTLACCRVAPRRLGT